MKVVLNNSFQVADKADVSLEDPNGIFSPTGNALPLPYNTQVPRNFYGSRFFEQTLPLVSASSPLVKNMNNATGRSWDYELGKHMGAVFAPTDGEVLKVGQDDLTIMTADGKKQVVDLYHQYPFNRNTMMQSRPLVKKGDKFKVGQPLVASNFTDDEGRMAMGGNARIAIVPFRGETMDDAGVISESFARRMSSEHANTLDLDKDPDEKTGKNHYVAMYPKRFTRDQLENLGDDGVVKPGTILQPGDPVRLATRPKTFRSDSADVGRLSRSGRLTRKDSAMVWDGDDPAEVLDVQYNRKGNARVLVRYESPTRPGDKMTLRNGQKLTVTRVIPDDRMVRGKDGAPMDLLLNQLGLPSRVNASTFWEIHLGKVAAKLGKPLTIPSTLPDKQSMVDFVQQKMLEAGVEPEEILHDPETGKDLAQPVTVGNAHVLKLHHRATKKLRYRGQGGYDINRMPMKGGGEGAGAQRLSGLEMAVLHSSGARGIQKESLLLRGEHRPDFWRAIRENRQPAALDKPYVWDKFLTLLNGSGVHARDLGKGKLRLTPLTDKDLEARGAVEIGNGRLIDMRTMEPVVGGLFDPAMTRKQEWGQISLPVPMINPAYESQVRQLLGLTQKELDELLDGTGEDKQASDEELYHGSPIAGVELLEPRPSRVLGGEAGLFATPSRAAALSFLAPWRDEDFEQGSINGRLYMREQAPGNYEKFFGGRKGYLYKLPSAGFAPDARLTRFERLSDRPAAPTSSEEIPDILAALAADPSILLLRYGDPLPGENDTLDKSAAIEDVRARLAGLDMDALREQALADIRSGKKTRRAKGVKILRAVEGIKRSGVAPEDLVITKVPVIPAGFRPYTVAGETFLPGDANELYADLIKGKAIYEESVAELGPEGAAEIKDYLRNAVRASYGYGDSPNRKLKARKVSGFFQKVVGKNPKTSWVQGKLLSKPQDHVGRSVISPDPKLSMDQVAIPEPMAWELFQDHVERRLTAQGIPKVRRLQLIKGRHPIARKTLDQEMASRPVIYSRAPAWHRQNVISGYASISDGDNIRISPLVSAGLNADYDGDTMAVHVPTLPEAVADAKEKILPSKMLFSIRDRDQTLPVPKHESLLGLYAAQTKPLKPAVKMRSAQEALAMYDSGRLGVGDMVEIGN